MGCALIDLIESPRLRDVQTELDPLLHAVLRPPLMPFLLVRPCRILPPGERPLSVVEFLLQFRSILSGVAVLLSRRWDCVRPCSSSRSVDYLHPGRRVGSSLGSRTSVSPAYEVSAALHMLALNRFDLDVDDVIRSVLRPASRQVWCLVREGLVYP